MNKGATITLDDMSSHDIYNLYHVLNESGKRCSRTVHEVSVDWNDMLQSAYSKCYNNDKSFTIVFKSQDASILLHILDEFVSRNSMRLDRYGGIAISIYKMFAKG